MLGCYWRVPPQTFVIKQLDALLHDVPITITFHLVIITTIPLHFLHHPAQHREHARLLRLRVLSQGRLGQSQYGQQEVNGGPTIAGFRGPEGGDPLRVGERRRMREHGKDVESDLRRERSLEELGGERAEGPCPVMGFRSPRLIGFQPDFDKRRQKYRKNHPIKNVLLKFGGTHPWWRGRARGGS